MLKHLALAMGLSVAATAAGSGPAPSGGVYIQGAWSRPAAAGMNGAGFLTITNSGARPETLVSVSSPMAARVEMHQTSMTGGIMSMQRLESGIALPQGQSVVFAPGAMHLMVFGLKSPLKQGDYLPLTFNLASGRQLKAKAVVRLSPPQTSPAK